jgi:hypothetical protein
VKLWIPAQDDAGELVCLECDETIFKATYDNDAISADDLVGRIQAHQYACPKRIVPKPPVFVTLDDARTMGAEDRLSDNAIQNQFAVYPRLMQWASNRQASMEPGVTMEQYHEAYVEGYRDANPVPITPLRVVVDGIPENTPPGEYAVEYKSFENGVIRYKWIEGTK